MPLVSIVKLVRDLEILEGKLSGRAYVAVAFDSGMRTYTLL